jgi:hypothetical protein
MFLRTALCLLLALSPVFAQKRKKSGDDEVMRPNPAAATPASGALSSCPAGGPLGEMELKVSSVSGNGPLPFINIVHLTEGDVVQYAPVKRGPQKRAGDVALVLVPAKISGKEEMIVTDPKEADKSQQWKISQTTALVVFVYGPQGLSRKKVKSFLSQDDSLVAQLAEYADKTAQTQALIAALSNASSSSASVNAALTGFASQYGISVQLDKTAPPAAQAQTLFSAMNPQLANYNPLAGSSASVASQTASLATVAATFFFGSPVGLLAGGTSMLLNLKSIAFPDTQFRSSFAQPLKNADLNLCGDRGTTPPRTRTAFVWAVRIPNAATPKLQIGNANNLPLTEKSPMPMNAPEGDWKYLGRVRDWQLENGKGQSVSIPIVNLQNQKSLELDLTKANPSPGDYKLTGYWDWTKFEAAGSVHVRPLSDFEGAHLKPESQDQLLAKAGKIPVTVTGSDFEFTTKVEITNPEDKFFVSQPVRFLLPKGLRKGPQDQMDVQIDTQNLDPGRYQLLLSQGDNKSRPVDFRILANPPVVTNLPVIANEGGAVQHYVLKGERLDDISKLEAPGVTFDLGATASNNTERNVTVQLKTNPNPGATLPLKAYLRDRTEPLTFEDALRITGPLPVIASSKLSLPASMQIALHGDEFPAGSTLSAMLDVKNVERTSTIRLACAGDTSQSASLRIGEQKTNSNLQQLSPDQLFLAFDTTPLPAGCDLTATVDNGKDGSSDPYNLAHIIRIPQIDSLTPQGEQKTGTDGVNSLPLLLNGTNLEMIEKAGWDQTNGTAVSTLPTPVPGAGQKQQLLLALPAPSDPNPTLYLWLRGDKQGRATTVKYATPAAVPAGGGAKSVL